MQALVTAGAGFLLAVLWFDLMFDVQVLRHRRGDGDVPEDALASVAGYYRRVTTEARPMNRLIALVMVATVVAVIVRLARGDESSWAGWASVVLVGAPVVLARVNTIPRAVRLGRRGDPLPQQAALVRAIGRDHLFCLASIAGLLVVQLT